MSAHTAPAGTAAALHAALSEPRMRTYLVATANPSHDIGKALQLYDWNVMAAGVFQEVLGHVEVMLRNALARQLAALAKTRWAGASWLDDPGNIFTDERLLDIETARSRISKPNPSDDRVLAELTFGFWRFLLSSRYEATLWTPALRMAFPNLKPANRSTIYDAVTRLHDLRNRVAHHEPIFGYPLDKRHDDALAVVEMINPLLRPWVERKSRWEPLRAVRPPTVR